MTKNGRVNFLIIVGIFAVTFFFRIYNIHEFLSYHQDQVRDLLFIKDHLENHKAILLGPKASVGNFYLPPLWYYMMSVGYLISHSPIAPAIMVALFSSLAVIFVYLFGKLFFNRTIAVIAALLYAVSHLSIEYSRFSWNPNPIPFFSIMALFFLFLYIQTKKNWFYFVSIIAAVCAFQLHYQGFILLATCLFVPFFTSLPKIKNFAIAIGIIVALHLPFLLYESTHHFENISQILSFFTSSSKGKLLGINNSIKVLIFELPPFIARTLTFSSNYLGIFLTIFLHIYLLYHLIRMKLRPKNMYDYVAITYLFSLFILFMYRNWIVDYYLLVNIIPLVIFFTITIFKVFPQKIAVVLSSVLILANFATSPVFKNPEPTLPFFEQVAAKLEQENTNLACVDDSNISIVDLKFAKKGVEYIAGLNPSYKPSNKCTKHFDLCEKVHCDTIDEKVLYSNQALSLQFQEKKH